MPTIVANEDGSYTITVPAPAAVASTQTITLTSGETLEVIAQ